MMDSLKLFLSLAFVVETLTQLAKRFFPNQERLTLYTPLLLAGLMAIAIPDTDLFAALGIVANIPYIGRLFGWMIISGGSNLIYDLVSLFRNIGTNPPNEQIEWNGGIDSE